jgi:hypothetical protein
MEENNLYKILNYWTTKFRFKANMFSGFDCFHIARIIRGLQLL